MIGGRGHRNQMPALPGQGSARAGAFRAVRRIDLGVGDTLIEPDGQPVRPVPVGVKDAGRSPGSRMHPQRPGQRLPRCYRQRRALCDADGCGSVQL